jgi:LuxR family maltose regulon positive regulatory protein
MYEWNDLDAAAKHVTLAVRASRKLGDRFELVFATNVSALIDAATGPAGVDRGLRHLRGLVADLDGWPATALLHLVFAGTEARLLAMRDNPDAAWASLNAEPSQQHPSVTAIRAQLHLQEGRPWEGLDALAPLVQREPRGNLSNAIEVSILEAIARSVLRDRDASACALERALVLAAPNRHRRPFLNGGPTVRQLLVDHLRNASGSRAFLGELLEIFDSGHPRPALGRLLEPLSEREAAVLSYLPTMLSNKEIATELFVSVNTVKTHVRSIYRKLGARNRRDAVVEAQARDLV